MPPAGANPRSTGSEQFVAQPSPLNVLPSRQNVVWEGHALGIAPMPGGPLSMSPCREVERLLASPLRAPTAKSLPDTASFDLDEPLLNSEAPESLAKPRRSKTEPAHEATRDGVDEKDALGPSEAIFNLTNTVVGVGVLSVPYAFRLSGYCTLLLIIGTIAVTSHTGKLIGAALVLASRSAEAKEVPRKGRDFVFLAHVAFGAWGRYLVRAVTALEIWFALVTFMVMNGVNVGLILPVVGRAESIAISCIMAALTSLVPMRVLSYLSVAASAALVVAACALVGSAFMMKTWANPYDVTGSMALIEVYNIPRSIGIIIFCFAGHPCFPVVHECMRDRRDWSRAVDVTFVVALVYYGSLGVFGFLVFGEELSSAFTENMARISGAAFWRTVAVLAFTVKIQLTAPLLLSAVMVSAWAPTSGEREWPPLRVVAFVVLTGLTGFVAAAFADDAGAVASLSGSCFVMMTSVLFPTLVYLRLTSQLGFPKERLVRGGNCVNALVILFGVSMAAIGTTLAVKDLVLKQAH